MSARTKFWIAATMATVLAVGAVAILVFALSMRENANNTPHGDWDWQEAATGFEAEDDPFPIIDWKYWKDINPDVVGWITIPGTNIDSPVVAAPKGDPEHYLHHDVYGNWNVYGAIYVDPECPEGLDSKNAVILGHHMIDGSMLSEASNYSNEEFAEEHRTILLQTPEWKRKATVQAAEIIGGWELAKQTSWSSGKQFRDYVKERISNCAMVLGKPLEDGYPSKMLTLCTCSYNIFPDNERTLVYSWIEE